MTIWNRNKRIVRLFLPDDRHCGPRARTKVFLQFLPGSCVSEESPFAEKRRAKFSQSHSMKTKGHSLLPTKFPLCLLLAAALLAAEGHAAPDGPTYPPPGGVTFAASGNGASAGQAGGRTNFYTSLDSEAYGDLYWTFVSIDNPRHSSQSDTGDMVFAGFDPGTGIATWNSTANMVWSTAFGVQSVATKVIVQFQPYSGINSGPLGTGWLVPTTAEAAEIDSLPSTNWALAGIEGENFQVWYQFQTASGSPLLSYYDNSHSLGGSVATGVTGGFYSTVPEPGAGLLVAAGLSTLFLRRKMRTSK
jgi:hypothetical protein